jgi:hypothetical protein
MTYTFPAPAGLLARKPAHGKPCTNCGLCCIATLCDVGRAVFGRARGPCPALQWEGDQSRCGILADPDLPEPLRDAAATLLYIGQGCDARFNGEPSDPAFHAAGARYDRINKPDLDVCRRLWGIPTTP